MSAGPVPAPRVVPNVGAEEGPGWRALRREPRVRVVAALFEALFEGPPVFPWLALPPGRAVAWWVTEEAREEASRQGDVLTGPAPEIVARVHDKAFAARVAEREGWVPEPLRGCVHVLSPEELAAPDAVEAIRARVAAWPAWTRGRFTLKPRFGTSARGRVGGEGADDAMLRGALPRLRERGGAVLEPWLPRCGDASTQLHVDDEGVTLLGTLQPVTTPAGVVLGHRGSVDRRGRVASGAACDETLREAAAVVAAAARDEGYRGPCGVDAFCFTGPDGARVLRPVVELNARFTVGTLALAAVRRVLPALVAELGLAPGERLPFWFGLDAPPGGWPAPAPDRWIAPLPSGGTALRPALWVERDARRLPSGPSGPSGASGRDGPGAQDPPTAESPERSC